MMVSATEGTVMVFITLLEAPLRGWSRVQIQLSASSSVDLAFQSWDVEWSFATEVTYCMVIEPFPGTLKRPTYQRMKWPEAT